MIFETFRQAIQNVWSNKLRTFLTMLGIIIGVMAVIVIVGLGNGRTAFPHWAPTPSAFRCGATAPVPCRWRRCTISASGIPT